MAAVFTAVLQKEVWLEGSLCRGGCVYEGGGVAGREPVQHAGSDAGWRLGRCDSGLSLDPETQTHRRVHLLLVTVLKRFSVSECLTD